MDSLTQLALGAGVGAAVLGRRIGPRRAAAAGAVLGTLPDEVGFITTFSAGLCAGSSKAAAVRDLLDFMNSPEAADVKRRHGMAPAGPPQEPQETAP